ncbi:piggyBac transposable element-derived protein 4 [Trichonephila clavipes]|nr:piggyBac transposable element-derived protein 4 [Trichonephila clavipes]
MVEESIRKYSDRDNCSGPGRSSSTLNPLRLTARHFASHIPSNPIKREPRRQCAVCCSRKDANGKKNSQKNTNLVQRLKLDFALNPVSSSIILN